MLKPLAPFPDVNHPAALDAYGLAPVIDGHNDLAWTARETAAYSVENLEKDSIFQTDIDKLGRGGVGAQFWSVYTPCDRTEAEAVQYTLEQIDYVYRMIERYPDTFEFARTGDDVRRIWSEGKVASLLGAEAVTASAVRSAF